MRVTTAHEMRAIDKRAVSDLGIPSILLMENAGFALMRAVERHRGALSASRALTSMGDSLAGARVCILCGPGNNGGDGLVLARHLAGAGSYVDVFLFGDVERMRGDALANLRMLNQLRAPKVAFTLLPMGASLDALDTWAAFRRDAIGPADEAALRLALARAHVVVDACFGTGFSGELASSVRRAAELVAEAVHEGGDRRPWVVAADIPSGVDADTGRAAQGSFRVDATVTFALPKLGLLLEPGRELAGELAVAGIGIPELLLTDPNLQHATLTAKDAASLLPHRPTNAHKGTFGRTVVAAGSPGLTGAAYLASAAAVKAGAGLVTLCTPVGVHPVLEVKTTEAMTLPCPETPAGTFAAEAAAMVLGQLAGGASLVLGPGLGRHPELAAFVARLVAEAPGHLLIDADGLNHLDTAVLATRAGKPPAILTPHPGEMARLTGLPIPQIEANRIAVARKYAKEWGCYVLLKGASTIIAGPSGFVCVNTTGNPGMATGGTGDCLSGIVGSFLAQGLPAGESAALGAYVHGRAGDIAVQTQGMAGMCAGDLLAALPAALKELEEMDQLEARPSGPAAHAGGDIPRQA